MGVPVWITPIHIQAGLWQFRSRGHVMRSVYHKIHFNRPPKLSSVLMVEGQRYELITIEPHVRQDGSRTSILHWQSHCPECGEAFIATSGLQGKNVNRRCTKHHKRGRPVANKKSYHKPYQKKFSTYRSKKIGGRYGK